MTKEELMQIISQSKPKQWDYRETRAFTGHVCAETITLKPGYDISIWHWNKYSGLDLATHEFVGKETYILGYNYPDDYLPQEFLKQQLELQKESKTEKKKSEDS